MAAAGYFRDEDRFELVGGEIVPMSPKGRRHEIIRGKLAFQLSRLAPEEVFVIAEPQFNLADDTYTLPDILVHPVSIETPDVRGETSLLVIEIADSSLGYDLNTKASLYATHRVPEYWVISAATLVTTVYRQPSGNAYAFAKEVPPTALLVPFLSEALGISLGRLALSLP